MLVKSRGFTVVELMIVVAIVAILMAIAVPSFRGTLATTRIKTSASDIHLSLVRARSEAIKRNTNITVSATGGNWTSGWTVSGGIETHGTVTGAVTIAGTDTIVYSPNGRTMTGPVAINLSSADAPTVLRCVTVTLGGQPVIKDGAC